MKSGPSPKDKYGLKPLPRKVSFSYPGGIKRRGEVKEEVCTKGLSPTGEYLF